MNDIDDLMLPEEVLMEKEKCLKVDKCQIFWE